ncbi:MAG: IS30 family transposase [Clostridia bacterium]|nr:IS30 family transposase [Clostridia bacterium]
MCQKNYNIEKEKNKEFKYKHLNYTERTQIERWYNIEHKSCSEIAKLLNKSVRTIQREIKRGLVIVKDQLWRDKAIYDAETSQRKYEYYIHSKGAEIKLGTDYELSEYIEKGIKEEKKSPEILINDIKKYSLKFKCNICAKTVRNCIKKGILNIRPKDMIYKKEYKDKKEEKYHCIKVPAEKSIDNRPEEANKREEYGHWEGDLVVGKANKGSTLLTLTERKTREEIIIKIPGKKAEYVEKAIDELERKYKEIFYKKFKTITFDNGGEFRKWEKLERSYDKRRKKKRIEVFYAHPYRSGERGSNENNNRLIRRFIPKGTEITNVSEEFIEYIENWINNLSRPMFGYKSSLELVRDNI